MVPTMPPLVPRIPFGIIALAILVSSLPLARAIQWQPPSTEAESKALANLPEYDGVGIVSVPGSAASGALISESWVLSAGHVVRGKTSGTFFLNGLNRSIDQIFTLADSDVALLHLSSPVTSTAYPAFAPYQYSNEVGNEVVLVGFGEHGQTGTTLTGDFTIHAATNRIDSVRDIGGIVGESLVFSNTPSGPSKTSLEGATAPGDSGGPMFMIENGRRWIVGETFGAIGGVGFVHGRVSAYKDWIETTTGINFNAVEWDTAPGTTGTQNGSGTWNKSNSNWKYSTQNFGWVDTYDATFGSGSGATGTITLGESLGVGDLTFNAAASGNTLIAGGGNTLTLKPNSILTANAEATISAPLSAGTINKEGGERLTFASDNAITGQTRINEGNLRIQDEGGLGDGGFNAATMTIVADGGALEIDTGAGTHSISEHIAIAGIGIAGQGSLVNVSGDNTLTIATRLDADARIRVLDDSTLRARSFFSNNTSTYELVRTGNGFLTVDVRLDVGSLRINGGTTHLLANAAASSKLTGGSALINGSLQINHQAALGTGNIEFSGGTFGGLQTLTGTKAVANPYSILGGSTVTIANTGATSIELSGAGSIASGTGTMSVAASQTAILSGGIGGAGSFTKSGDGTVQLDGTHTYTGATTVSAGTLRINGSLSGTSGATIANGATLAGNGSLTSAGNVTLAAGSRLAPDGQLTLSLATGQLDLTAAITADNSQSLSFDLGLLADQVRLTAGALNIGTNTLGFDDFVFQAIAGFGAGSYVLFDTDNPIFGSLQLGKTTGQIDGYTATLLFGDNGRDLFLTVVPEPSTLTLCALGLLAFCYYVRRQNRSSEAR